jgi:hypothetical protein
LRVLATVGFPSQYTIRMVGVLSGSYPATQPEIFSRMTR